MVEEQLYLSYQTLRRLLNVAGTEDSLLLEQVEETLRQEEGNLSAGIETNEKRLERLNAFGYPSLADEQVKLQKELARQQNIRQLTEALKKVMSEIEHLEKEAADCSKELSEREVALKTVQRLYENARMAVGKDVKALRRQLEEEIGRASVGKECRSRWSPYH